MKNLLKQIILCLILLLSHYCTQAHAQESQCATVKLDLGADLTFERQAFDAKLKITNGLSDRPLTQVNVTVWFKDQDNNLVAASTDPNASSSTNAFYYNIFSLDGISAVNGTAQIAPASIAEIHWLIIPTDSAAGGLVGGKLYYVGATLSFMLDGELNQVEIAPDFITVRPQPKLKLDYFLPQYVRADEPFTSAIEPPVPFSLGLRISNIGLGSANNTKIESSQPEIRTNDTNLLISFTILGSAVDDFPSTPSLLLDFGDIGANATRVGRWTMQTTLSGSFEEFDATFSHADELGGRLTSLLDSVNTHRLIRDVRVDLPNSDNIRDFLAFENDLNGALKLFESDGQDQVVSYFENQLVTPTTNSQYYIDLPQTSGPIYLKVLAPGAQTLLEVVSASRADGKIISLDNAWISLEPDTLGNNTRYFNLFDYDGGGRYHFGLGTPVQAPQAPALQFIQSLTKVEGQTISFLVTASNPNLSTAFPSLSVDLLPIGASFVDNGNGTGLFTWNTSIGQAGIFPVTFRATINTPIGILNTLQTPIFTVQSIQDSDNDTMLDLWEQFYFGGLTRNGSEDFDGDGISDLNEFLNGMDPTLAGNAPSVPEIKYPLPSLKLADSTPLLEIHNSTRGMEVENYSFEIYADQYFQNMVESQSNIAAGISTTSYQVLNSLNENNWYYWRARANLYAASSEWVYGRFFVNTQNDAPTGMKKIWPLAGEKVDLLNSGQLTFEIFNAIDPDQDNLNYLFEVSAMHNGQEVTMLSLPQLASELGRTKFTVTIQPPASFLPPYKWRVIANDGNAGTQDTGWSEFILNNTGTRPSAPFTLSPVGGLVPENVPQGFVDLTARIAQDLETPSSLSYFFEISTNPNFDAASPVTVTQAPYAGLYPDLAIARTTNLVPNTKYYWRVRAYDGQYYGRWSYASFIYDNQQNSLPTVPAILNPGNGSRVDLITPNLKIAQSQDSDGIIASYQYQVYADPNLNQLLVSEYSNDQHWLVPQNLTNNHTYYWRTRAQDNLGAYSNWSTLTPFLVSLDNINNTPKIRIVNSNNGQFSVSYLSGLKLEWEDSDPDSDAEIYFVLNGGAYSSYRNEDRDDTNDIFEVKPFNAPVGTYQFTPAISDGSTFSLDSNCCTITVTNSNTTGDIDSDGILDQVDNCLYYFNPTQDDHGGILNATPDGIGDACQCGDVNGDGVVSESDLDAIDAGLQKVVDPSFRHPEKCDLNGDQACTWRDYEYLNSTLQVYIANGGTGPAFNGCEASIW